MDALVSATNPFIISNETAEKRYCLSSQNPNHMKQIPKITPPLSAAKSKRGMGNLQRQIKTRVSIRKPVIFVQMAIHLHCFQEMKHRTFDQKLIIVIFRIFISITIDQKELSSTKEE